MGSPSFFVHFVDILEIDFHYGYGEGYDYGYEGYVSADDNENYYEHLKDVVNVIATVR